MKIAMTSQGPGLDQQVDPRFGRAAYVLVIDSETMEYEALDNSSNVNAFKGAGIQAATMIHDHGAQVLLTGYCGPKAFQTLQAANIKVVNDVSGTVSEALETFKTGNPTFTAAPNAEAHW
jgi:predicted Fe-Mo cluster-binding NifX family protein